MKQVIQTVPLVLLILFMSLALRLPFVGVPALNGDEGDNFDTVKLYLEKGVSPWERMVFTPPPYYWAVAGVAHFFGLNETSLRSVSLFFGVLTPLLLFFFARYLFRNDGAALVTGTIAAVLPFLVVYSRDAHIEAMQFFLVVSAVWVLEIFLSKKKSLNWWLLASVSITWLAVSVKYNAILPLGLYWLFNIVSSGKEWKRTLKLAVVINALAFVLVLLLTGFVPVRLAYFAYGVLSWSINQSADANVPWYYYIAVLFEGLSPIIVILFAGSLWWWLRSFFCGKGGKIARREWLVFFLCVAMLVVVFIQGRKYPRHLVLIVPWIVLLVGDVVWRMLVWLKKKHKLLPVVFMLFIIAGAGWWSIGKIVLYNQHTVWRDVGAYLIDTVPENATVYIDGGDYWPLVIHANYSRKITSALRVDSLKKNDVVILYDIDMAKPFVMGSPFQNDLFWYNPAYAVQYPMNPKYVQKTAGHQPPAQQFYEYALSKGAVVKEFKYDAVNKIKIIKITKASRQMQNNIVPKIKHDRVIQGICDVFVAHSIVQDSLQKFSKRLYEEVQMKCAKGCVRTCGIF